MKQVNPFLSILFFICFTSANLFNTSLYAQKFFPGNKEIGILIGGSNYHGDLAREIVMSETNFMIGAYFEKNINEWISTRYQLAYGKISGSDQNFDIYKNRNLSFFSPIFEASVVFEYNFFPFGLNPNLAYFSPYLFGGIGVFRFNPKTIYNDEVVQLRDLGTEGQGLTSRKYNLIQPCMPIGFGMKIKSSKRMLVGIEVGFRKTWTDFLDDVTGEYPDYDLMLREKGELAALMSHRYKELDVNETAVKGLMRGDPHLNDWYFFMNLRIAYKFGRGPCGDNYSF
jgi:hypothetical protein